MSPGGVLPPIIWIRAATFLRTSQLCISQGLLREAQFLKKEERSTVWSSTLPLPTLRLSTGSLYQIDSPIFRPPFRVRFVFLTGGGDALQSRKARSKTLPPKVRFVAPPRVQPLSQTVRRDARKKKIPQAAYPPQMKWPCPHPGRTSPWERGGSPRYERRLPALRAAYCRELRELIRVPERRRPVKLPQDRGQRSQSSMSRIHPSRKRRAELLLRRRRS